MYSPKEVGEMIIASHEYTLAYNYYQSLLSIAPKVSYIDFPNFKKNLDNSENSMNKARKKCEEKVPKSLLKFVLSHGI